MKNLWQTKTFWVGVVSVIAAVVAAVFGGNETIDHFSVAEAAKALASDPKLYVGVAAITGRAALIGQIEHLLGVTEQKGD